MCHCAGIVEGEDGCHCVGIVKGKDAGVTVLG